MNSLFVCLYTQSEGGHPSKQTFQPAPFGPPWGHAELVSVTFRQLQAIQTGYQPLADSLCVS